MTHSTIKPATPLPYLARNMFYGASENDKYTPYISAGDTATVLCFANLSGAYNGFAGCAKAKQDFNYMCHAANAYPELVAALRCSIADLEGILPEFEPSGDRQHPAWKTVAESRALLAKLGEG